MPLSHCSADCCNVLQCVVTCCHEDPAEKKVFIPFRKCRHPVQLLFGALNVTIGSTGSVKIGEVVTCSDYLGLSVKVWRDRKSTYCNCLETAISHHQWSRDVSGLQTNPCR